MRKRKIILLVFIATTAMLLAFSACQAKPTPDPTAALSATPSSTATTSLTPTKTVTATPMQTYTSSPTLNPRDFDASTIKTITPAAPAQCPAVDTSIDVDIENLIEFLRFEGEEPMAYRPDMEKIHEYLNQGVPIETIVNKFNSSEEYNSYYQVYFEAVDVTGDGIKEIIYSYPAGLEILGCNNQRYQIISTLPSPNMGPPINHEIIDVNSDNLLDITVLFSGCMGGLCPSHFIYTWDGRKFISLNPHGCVSTHNTPFAVALTDIDNNGTYEKILRYEWGDYPNGMYDTYPLRTEEITCMWNGIEYLTVNIEYGPPIYRFQAASDAGGQLFYGNNEEALALYQQTIDDPSLEWYTDDRNVEAYWNYVSDYWGGIDVEIPPLENLEPNPDEYDNLAAYAYFRIIMIHLLQDDVSTAETVFEEMVEKYPVGCKQSLLAESAEIMLDSYKQSEDIHATCTEVVKFVKPRQDELFKLYDYFYWAGISSPPGLCPYWEGDYTSY